MSEMPPPPPEGTVPPPPPPGDAEPPQGPPTPPPPGGTQSTPPEGYPVDLDIDYQDRELNRTTTFFRIFVAIPILIILGGLTSGGAYAGGDHVYWGGAASGLIVFPTALMIIFEEKYPRWWFDFNKELVSFVLRVSVFMLLIDDRYPSTTDGQGVHLQLDYPNVDGEISRFMPIIKWLLAIPHWIILFFLWIGVIFGTIYAWFVILFTGRYPRDVYDFVSGVMRWHMRVAGYAVLLVTDEYPPFRLEK